MDSALDIHDLKALLDWQGDLGATEAIGDVAINRYELPDTAAKPARAAAAGTSAPSPTPLSGTDAVAVARAAAAAAPDLAGLRAALAAYEHCEIKRGARNLVFCDGRPGARVMIIGEAPGREEDREGRPFIGAAGQLLDRMLAAIGLSRTGDTAENAVYITNVLPWRPPQNRDPRPDEIAMLTPFVARHVQLADPDLVILMGNISCQAALDQRGVTRLRGTWTQAYGKPAMPMCHPAYLLRTPLAKRDAWADLLQIKARLRGDST